MIREIDLSVLDRHDKIALCVSGGKDSTAVLYLLRDYLPRIVCYHMDTGDLLPETVAIVEHLKAMAPNFVHIRGDVASWIAANGRPSDLVTHGSHMVGQAMGETATPLVARYDCCWINLMAPIYRRIRDDGNTLLIRGTKRQDMNRLPVASAEVYAGVEFFYPIQEWTADEVFAYLRVVRAPVSRVYDHVTNSPECARCTAWWGEQRAAYLKRYHPALYEDYRGQLAIVADEISGPIKQLRRELAEMELL